ncbi:hypothetical protein, variant [Verruconis gallopava]|nr:hypothetical protein, variant [Verruconis gallopava]KIW01295.1 hypothetical protein, variant [Verruconis gallopava]
MSRQKLNQTRLTQSKRINWTVEWIDENSISTVASIFDDEELYRGYRPVYLKRAGSLGRKRKRDGGPSTSRDMLDRIQDRTPPPTGNLVSAKELIENSTLKRSHEDVDAREPLTTPAADSSTAPLPAAPVVADTDSAQASATVEPGPEHDDAVVKGKIGQRQLEPLPTGSSDDLGLYYYLVKPRTSGSEHVLVPLSPTDTLLTCLRNQTVLEFPSIQVLPSSPDALPAGFVTEDEYLARFKKEAHEMEQLMQEEGEVAIDSDPTAGNRNSSQSHAIDNDSDTAIPNPSTLLATLERDMKS